MTTAHGSVKNQSYPLPRNDGQRLVQNDIWQTPLPNGSLRRFGFDFDRVELPDEPVLRGEEKPRWIGEPPQFVHRSGISDANLTVEVDEFTETQEYEDDPVVAEPKRYRVTLDAHGMNRPETFTCASWREVQQRCARAEARLDESHAERHEHCVDDMGMATEHACRSCEVA